MLLRSPLALHHNYSITGVALFSALCFPSDPANQEDVATPVLWDFVLRDFVLLQFMAALRLLSAAGSSRPSRAGTDAICFSNEGFKIAV